MTLLSSSLLMPLRRPIKEAIIVCSDVCTILVRISLDLLLPVVLYLELDSMPFSLHTEYLPRSDDLILQPPRFSLL
jgi:hypothetical protein